MKRNLRETSRILRFWGGILLYCVDCEWLVDDEMDEKKEKKKKMMKMMMIQMNFLIDMIDLRSKVTGEVPVYT